VEGCQHRHHPSVHRKEDQVFTLENQMDLVTATIPPAR
jgi:hypothetical protein